jgi:hypothetical protein
MPARLMLVRLFALLLVSSLSVLAAGCRDPGPAASRAPGVRTEDDVRHARVQKQFSSWDGSHKGVTGYIKRSLGNPASFEHISTKYDDRLVHVVVTTTYRFRNGAGELVNGSITAKVDLDGKVLEVLSRRP